MKSFTRLTKCLTLSAILTTWLQGQISFTGPPFMENFNTMGLNGTSPPGAWSLWRGNGNSASWTNTDAISASGAESVASMIKNSGGLEANDSPSAKRNDGYNAKGAGSNTDRLIATCPTSVSGSAIQLRLTNNSPAAINAVSLAYEIHRITNGEPGDDELPGYQIFYSLDGGSTWRNEVPLNPVVAGSQPTVIVPKSPGVTAVPPTVVRFFTPWEVGSELRIRWVDDNSKSSGAEPVHGLDNVTVDDVNLPLLPPPSASLTAIWAGGQKTDGATVVGMLDSETTGRIAISLDAAFTNPVFSPVLIASPSSGIVFRHTFTGLTPQTGYYYAAELGGNLQIAPEQVGRFTTLPSAGPASFKFSLSSCGSYSETANQFVYDAVQNRDGDSLFFLQMGDINYNDTNSTDPNAYRSNYRSILTESAPQGRLFRRMPIVYMWDDHDFSGNDSFKGSSGQGAHRQVYREMVPHQPLGAGPGNQPIHQAFTVGRVRFVITDLRSERDNKNLPDNASKSIMGAAQKAWFKNELTAARDAEVPLIVWNSSVPLISTGTGGDDWGRYQTERLELLTFIRDEGIKNIIIVSGDMHALALDNGQGTANYLAGVHIPVFHAAALARGGSSKGGPYSAGSPSSGKDRYGVMDVEDAGTPGGIIQVTLTGLIASNSTTTSVWDPLNLSTGYTYRYDTNPVKPRKPIELSIIKGAARLIVNWTDDSSVETGYLVERRPGAGGDWTPLATVPANTTTYTDTTVEAGASYSYRVTTVNGTEQTVSTDTAVATTNTPFQD